MVVNDEKLAVNFKKILGNTENIYLNELLKSDHEVIKDIEEILALFNEETIELNDWGLSEVSMNEYDDEKKYCFENWNTGEFLAFANYLSEDRAFLPVSVDYNSNEQAASSIIEAVKFE